MGFNSSNMALRMRKINSNFETLYNQSSFIFFSLLSEVPKNGTCPMHNLISSNLTLASLGRIPKQLEDAEVKTAR